MKEVAIKSAATLLTLRRLFLVSDGEAGFMKVAYHYRLAKPVRTDQFQNF